MLNSAIVTFQNNQLLLQLLFILNMLFSQIRRFILFLIILCYSLSFHAQETINIELVSTSRNPNYSVYWFCNGNYTSPESFISTKDQPRGFLSVSPGELLGSDSVLKITSLEGTFMKSPFEIIPASIGTTLVTSNDIDLPTYKALNKQIWKYKSTVDTVILGITNQWELYISNDYVKYESTEFDLTVFVFPDTFHQKYPTYVDSIQQIGANYRQTNLQPLVDSLLTPFYFSLTEITNQNYRMFVRAIQDSIMTKTLYDSLPYSAALNYLNCSKKEQRLLFNQRDTLNRQELLVKYGLNFTKITNKTNFSYAESKAISNLYLLQNERFYKRREFNTHLINYSLNGKLIPIYPDTTVWVTDSIWNGTAVQHLTSDYFWHPSYDHFPVVGLRLEQQLAYCHWIGRQFTLLSHDPSTYFDVQLPQLYHYEMALKKCVRTVERNAVNTQQTNFLIIPRTGYEASFHIAKVFPTSNMGSKPNLEALKNETWKSANLTAPIYGLLTGVSETTSDKRLSLSDSSTLQLAGNPALKIVDPFEHQFNTLFYRSERDGRIPSSTVGFRCVIYVRKR